MLVGLFVPIVVAVLLGQLTFIFNLLLYPLFIYYLMRKETRAIYK